MQGKLGGYTGYVLAVRPCICLRHGGPEHCQRCRFPDRTRGVLNEGGLFGERSGWHLPGFDTSSWVSRSLTSSLPNGPGIGFFVTTFTLDVPKDVDALMSFQFDTVDQPYRALLFVNGWQFGKVSPRTAHILILVIVTTLTDYQLHLRSVSPISARSPNSPSHRAF